MKTIGIFKEPASDKRVCIIPQGVQKLTALGLKVFVEGDAGIHAGHSNFKYELAGATLLEKKDVYRQSDILLSINHLYDGVYVEQEKTFVGIYNMLFYKERVDMYINDHISLYSLDLLPRSSKAQSMDVLSSMASLAGYKAVIKAAELYGSAMPMFTTAAGTLKPAKVLVLGAGVAGLQAIATARRLGAVVEAFDVRSAAAEEVNSLGAKFIEVPGAEENHRAGAYAIEQGKDYQDRQKELIHKHISAADIVISTANIPGKKAPVLIDENSVNAMHTGAVIVDLASEQGGNCVLTKDNAMLEHNGVRIIGNSCLAGDMPFASSQLLSSNYLAFIKHLLEYKNAIHQDPILSACKIIHKGELIHPSFIKETESV